MARSEPAAAAPGVVRLTGRDVLAVLHNISTQRFDDLAAGEARLALFCDFRGRLLHRVAAARVADGSVWLLREDAPGDALAAFLDRSVFREDVTIEDASAAWRVEWSAAFASGDALLEENGVPAVIAFAGGPVYHLARDGARADAGVSASARELTRIAVGWAAHGHEITEEFHPFEVNLGQAVHLDKGCFTGHESLMRRVTYKSVRRRLARLEGRGGVPAPAQVRRAGRGAGQLTSAAPQGDGWSALAVLAHEACEVGADVEIEGTGGARVAEVFTLRSPLGRPLRI